MLSLRFAAFLMAAVSTYAADRPILQLSLRRAVEIADPRADSSPERWGGRNSEHVVDAAGDADDVNRKRRTWVGRVQDTKRVGRTVRRWGTRAPPRRTTFLRRLLR